jgi:hypothetical protein
MVKKLRIFLWSLFRVRWLQYTRSYCWFKIHFSIIFLFTTASYTRHLEFRFPCENLVQIPHTSYIPHPSHPSLCECATITWCRQLVTEVMKSSHYSYRKYYGAHNYKTSSVLLLPLFFGPTIIHNTSSNNLPQCEGHQELHNNKCNHSQFSLVCYNIVRSGSWVSTLRS